MGTFQKLVEMSSCVHFHMTVLEVKRGCVMENQAMDRACAHLESQLCPCFHALLAPKRLSPEHHHAEMLLSEASLENLFLKFKRGFFLSLC